MNAREKLNGAYVNGSLALGALAGALTQSWLVFWIVAGLGLALNFYYGEIRTRDQQRR